MYKDFIRVPVFSSFGYVPRKRIAEARGSSIFSFGKLLTYFLQQLNHFTFLQQCVRVLSKIFEWKFEIITSVLGTDSEEKRLERGNLKVIS